MFVLLTACWLLSSRVSSQEFTTEDPCFLRDLHAECELQGHPFRPRLRAISGMVKFSQFVDWENCRMGHLNVDVFVENVPPIEGSLTSEHGFHVRQYGDMSRGCDSMGMHFNPYNALHGAPWMPPHRRHVGDFGNVVRRFDGTMRKSFTDYLATLHGPVSIIGRGLAITENRDDLGLGGDENSLVDGNSGDPIACCVIQRA